MKGELVTKYVKDLDGLLSEISRLDEDFFESESSVIFYFGVLYRYFNISGILIEDERRGELDAQAYIGSSSENELCIEFEFLSSNFHEHGHDPNKCDLIICWFDDWGDCPDSIDIIDLDYFWKKAKARNNPLPDVSATSLG